MKKWLKWIFIYVFKKTERPNAISKAFKTMDCERFFLKISVAKGKFRPRLLARLPTTTSSWAKATLVRQSIDATEKKRQFHLSLSLFLKKKTDFFLYRFLTQRTTMFNLFSLSTEIRFSFSFLFFFNLNQLLFTPINESSQLVRRIRPERKQTKMNKTIFFVSFSLLLTKWCSDQWETHSTKSTSSLRCPLESSIHTYM